MKPVPLRLGLVGAGRSRNGLGPFLARACEAAGARIVAVSGRDPVRSRANALELAAWVRHPVEAAASLDALVAQVDALVIASPAEHHLAALRAALARGLPCLCEKPVVAGSQLASGIDAALGFARRGLWLQENAIWPFVLPVVDALHGPRAGPVRHLAMGLSPRERGFRTMVEDSLPHLLSLVHATVSSPDRDALVVADVRWLERSADESELRVAIAFGGGGTGIETELHLKECPQQPRPMRFSVDGRAAERQIGEGYRLSFLGNGREVPVEDPLYTLCRSFVAAANAHDPAAATGEATGVAVRLCWFGEVLQRLFGA